MILDTIGGLVGGIFGASAASSAAKSEAEAQTAIAKFQSRGAVGVANMESNTTTVAIIAAALVGLGIIVYFTARK